MLNFYTLENKQEKQQAYESVREIARKDFPKAKLEQTSEGFIILWCGIAISEISKTSYDAWLDVVLPF